jgi:hypothetical protein
MNKEMMGFVAPRQTPRDALAVFHQAQDALTLPGNQHKIYQESLRVIRELVEAHEKTQTDSPNPP